MRDPATTTVYSDPDLRACFTHEMVARAVWSFAKRYVGNYLWLSLFTTVGGAAIGCAIFLPLFLFFPTAIGIGMIVGSVLSAPLNLIVLPPLFHILRDGETRQRTMAWVGCLVGLISPAAAVFYWASHTSGVVPAAGPVLLLMSLGGLSGLWCGWFFDRHGNDPSALDIMIR
jgi:hypothetical protein